jgi:spermidine/putrescine transport system ATP-binding protein
LQRQLAITFIFVTHDQEEALSMSDRVVVMEEGYIEQIGSPREVYEEPKTLNVAKFIGEVNIFEGTVLQLAEQNQATIDIMGKPRLIKTARPLAVNEKVNVLIRPEDIRVWGQSEVDQKESEDMLPGLVEDVTYKGSTVDLRVRLDNQRLISATEFFDEDDDRLEYKLKEPVWIHWHPGWEVILPHEE